MAEKHYEEGPTLLFRGLTVLFIFIGLAIFVSAVLSVVLNPSSMIPFMAVNLGWSWIWNIIGLLILIWILSWTLRWPLRRHRRYWNEDNKDIVRRRYAHGEINRKQYLEMIKDLENSRD